jgi:hydroxylaminobenzene mutase
MNLTTHQRTLVVAGALLFLIGLLQGAAVQSFLNPRMALSAHLTAVQSGMAMMIVGALWGSADLRATFSNIARWTIVIGMFGLWAGLTASAATGASKNLPIAGAGFSAARVTENLVSIAVLGGSVLMTIGWSIFVIELVRARR